VYTPVHVISGEVVNRPSVAPQTSLRERAVHMDRRGNGDIKRAERADSGSLIRERRVRQLNQ
jgi:hypothetical protein